MAQVGRLTALKVGRIKEPGMYADGGGLYLQVTVNARDRAPAKSWIYRFKLAGRARQMGLGSLSEFGLQQARERAAVHRRLRRDGIDPIEARKATRTAAALDAAKSITFKACAERYIEAHQAAWRNAKHAAQWGATLATYAEPVIGALSVQAVDTGLVLKVLEPIWSTKAETASRLRGRIEAILDWARVRGYRDGENPARWRGHLEALLPASGKVRRVEHHAALRYDEMSGFMGALHAQEGVSARALEFTILTVARTGEAIGATWGEIDLGAKTWIIPAARMKAAREHRVPLSARAVEILEAMGQLAGDKPAASAFVFQGATEGKPLSNMALLMLLRRMKRDDLTAHGFRSTFRDWAAERTNFPSEVAEMALAHAVGDKVEAAYRRGDLLDKRRRLMDEWARYCNAPRSPSADGKVTSLRRGA